MSIEMARLLCLKAAWAMDTQGARAAAPLISQIKVIAPRVALEVIDQAVQMHGGAGVSQDFPLARMWTHRAHAAPRRRAGRGASARHRQGRNEALHERGARAMNGADFPDDCASLDAWAPRMSRAGEGRASASKFPTGQSNPTYHPRQAVRPLRPAPQAARQAAQKRAYGRARISRDEGAYGTAAIPPRKRLRCARTRASSAPSSI